MKAEYTLINHNAWSVSIDTLTLSPRGKATRVLDLTEAQVELLNKQKVDVITTVNGVKRANSAIFAPAPQTSTVMLTPGSTALVDAIRLLTQPAEVTAVPDAPAEVTAVPDAPVPTPEAQETESITSAPADDVVITKVDDSAKQARQAELLAMNGNTLKAMVKKDPYNFTGTDGLSKAALVEKIVNHEFLNS